MRHEHLNWLCIQACVLHSLNKWTDLYFIGDFSYKNKAMTKNVNIYLNRQVTCLY